MDLIEIFFAFYRPVTIREIWHGSQDWRCVFGHVSAYGYTMDDTWIFIDPQGQGTQIHVTHLHDEVLNRLALIRSQAETIISFKPDARKYRFPLHAPMTCVTQCAALTGRRAYTPWGFRKMLQRNGAEIIWTRDENPEGRSEGQGSAFEGTPGGGSGTLAAGPD